MSLLRPNSWLAVFLGYLLEKPLFWVGLGVLMLMLVMWVRG